MPESSARRVEMVALDSLEPNPSNPKEHDLGALFQSLGRFGVADLPVVDGRTGLLVSGHGRADALAMVRDAGLGVPSGVEVDDDGGWLVPVVVGWSSTSDAEADAYLVAANRTVEQGGWNDDALVTLLGRLAEASVPLDGTGYDEDDLETLRRRLEATLDLHTDPTHGRPDLDPRTHVDAHWRGMPEFESDDVGAAFTCKVNFPTEADAERFFDDVVKRDRTRSFWWPESDGRKGASYDDSYAVES